jgi:hypothetical protein
VAHEQQQAVLRAAETFAVIDEQNRQGYCVAQFSVGRNRR